MATEPGKAGVWFWTASRNDSRLFHYDETAGLQSFVVGTSEDAKGGAGSDGLAVGADGIVWLGVGSTLYRLDPSTGKVSGISLPKLPDNAAAEAYRPPDLQGAVGIEGVAVNADDTTVAIAVRASAAALTYDTKVGTFSSLQLPSDTEANGAAFDSSNSLAFSLNDYATHVDDRVLLVRGSAVQTVDVPDASRIASFSAGGFIVGSVKPTTLTDDATVGSVAQPTGSAAADLSYGSLGLTQLPGGALVAPAGRAVAVFDPETGTGQLIGLGTYACPSIQVPPHTSPTSEATSPPAAGDTAECPAIAEAVTSDASGDVWFVSSGNSSAIGLISSL